MARERKKLNLGDVSPEDAQAFIKGTIKPEPGKQARRMPKWKKETIRFTLDMDPDQHKQLRMLAAEQGVPMAQVFRSAIEVYLTSLQ